jgi:hypothetical protein
MYRLVTQIYDYLEKYRKPEEIETLRWVINMIEDGLSLEAINNYLALKKLRSGKDGEGDSEEVKP